MALLSNADNAEAVVGALLAQAKRFGLTTNFRTATVLAPSNTDGRVMVTLDNDTIPVPVFNYAGPLATGQRVVVVPVAPHGLFAIGAINASSLPLAETFTVTGTARFTKTAGLIYARIQVQAAGGSGGGAGVTAAGQWAFGDGGGGGEYAEGIFLASQISDAGEIVTVGQGGIGSTGAGTSGSNSSFGTLVTCVGGNGGSVRTATNTLNYSSNTQTRNGGSGGTGGTIRVAGSPGGMGIGITSVAQGVRAGDGGQSFLAGGFVESLNLAGSPGRLYGGGGPGVANSAGQAAIAAMAGGNGIVIVTSYFA